MTKKQSKENTAYIITSSGDPFDVDFVVINGVKYQKVEEPKPKVRTLYDICVEWCDDDDDPPVGELIDAIEEWMSQYICDYVVCAEYLQGYNDAMKILKENLR